MNFAEEPEKKGTDDEGGGRANCRSGGMRCAGAIDGRGPAERCGGEPAIFDRYLDTALKYHDKDRLRFICLVAWGFEGDGKVPVLVTVVDPKTGEKGALALPLYGTPEAEALFKPLLLACQDRLQVRGLEKRVIIGSAWDMDPKGETVAMFHKILPEAGWLKEAHMRGYAVSYKTKDNAKVSIPVLYNSLVWGGDIPDPSSKRFYGWQHGQRLEMNFNRAGVTCLVLLGFAEPWSFHMWMESTLTCGRNGNGNCGGDFWPVTALLNRENRVPAAGSGAAWNGSGTLYGIYPASNVGRTAVGNNVSDLFGPGPDGPVSTIRFENALENNQECEARICIEKALLNREKPLPAEVQKLAGK